MAHQKFEFPMPAKVDVVFDAFHYQHWRHRWDSLVSATHVLGGEPCPFVGAVTDNAGAGFMRGLSMRTKFISYDRPQVAAATMLGRSFPFSRWSASMRHRAMGEQQSVLIYTYNFEVIPQGLSWLLEPFVKLIFNWQTRRRFGRLHAFLAQHATDVEQWQKDAAMQK